MNVTTSVNIPKMIISIELAGTNSLIGALCEELIKKDFMKDIGVLHPDEIVFIIKKVYPILNLYEEINKVRDILKIDEKKITVYVGINA